MGPQGWVDRAGSQSAASYIPCEATCFCGLLTIIGPDSSRTGFRVAIPTGHQIVHAPMLKVATRSRLHIIPVYLVDCNKHFKGDCGDPSGAHGDCKGYVIASISGRGAASSLTRRVQNCGRQPTSPLQEKQHHNNKNKRTKTDEKEPNNHRSDSDHATFRRIKDGNKSQKNHQSQLKHPDGA